MNNVEIARANLLTYDASTQNFVRSLLEQFDRRGSLSPRQLACIDRIVTRAPRAAGASATAPVFAQAGIDTMYGWLRGAQTNGLRRVRVSYPAVIGRSEALSFSLPSATSRYAGQTVVFVKVDGNYAGRLQNGAFHASRDVTVTPATLARIEAIIVDPLAAAVASGHASGACCFCSRQLDDPRSVAHGYGPICAGHYNLPWDANRDAARAANVAAAFNAETRFVPVAQRASLPINPFSAGEDL